MKVKICGLSDAATVDVSVAAGAAYVGFVFFPRSPRNVSIDQARGLAARVPQGVCRTGLFVDADDGKIGRVLDSVSLDMIQLHGSESRERARAIRNTFGLPVMKSFAISADSDVEGIDRWLGYADQLLVDAPQAQHMDRPGGQGIAVDWRLLANRKWRVPWMLAGGLTRDNVSDAVRLTGATQLDVSSGVESAPGMKDCDLIRAFLRAAGAVSDLGEAPRRNRTDVLVDNKRTTG